MAARISREEIDVIAQEYANLVKREINVESIYLFGSSAKGSHDQDSDIDIAVIAEDFGIDFVDDIMKLMRIRRKVDIRIEPHPLRKDNPFVKEVIATGLRIG